MFSSITSHRDAASVSPDGAQSRPDSRIAKVAREFEALFMLQMLRQMRQAMAGDEDRDPAMAPLMDTIDEEVSRVLAYQGGIGLAETLAKALGAANGDENAGTSAATALPAGLSRFGGRVDALRSGAVADTGYYRSKAAAPIAAATGPAATLESGALPLATTVSTSAFGWRMDPFTGQPRFHRGVDLRAAYGSQVTSVAPGRVVWAGDQKGYGTTVVVEHGDGWCTRYAHLSTLAVKAGDVVSAGQEIGRAGSSGRSTGPHLHFEVTLRGEPVDPERFLPALDGAQVPLKKSGEVADSSYDGGSVRSPGASDED